MYKNSENHLIVCISRRENGGIAGVETKILKLPMIANNITDVL
jgi:hypothetical protein